MKAFQFIILTFSFLFIFASCNQSPQSEDGGEIAQVRSNGKIVLTREQTDLAGFEFGKIEPKILSGDVAARGKLTLPNKNQAFISPVMRGVVSSINVTPGQMVKKGQVMAYLTHPDYIELQQQYLTAINSLEFLENDFARQTRLYNENVSSEKKYLQTKTDFQGTKAKAKSLELMLDQIGLDVEIIKTGEIITSIPVKTPIDGVVNSIMVSLGMNISEGDELFEVTCRKKLFVDIDVFEKDIMKVEKGQRVSFVLSNVDSKSYEATIISIGGKVTQAGRVVKVLAEFENQGEMLFPGMFVAAKIHTGEEEFEALPESAIMNYGSDKPYIFYTTSNPDSPEIEFAKTPIVTGFEEDGFIQVKLLSQIPHNARIVTRGGYYVDAESGEED
jgi:cobalt-zinc-cadmium efflux system membrane fusion protein